MSQLGAFKDTESSGVYVGFIAGVLGANPARAERLIGKMLSIPEADQWAIVRAIAYSGLPDWKGLLGKFAERMPMRKTMIEKYLAGELPPLDGIPLEKHNPTLWDKVTGKPEKPERDDVRPQPRTARHPLGHLFRHRQRAAGHAHPRHAALVERARQHRPAHRRRHGEISR